MKVAKASGKKARIEIIPLIDVIMFLLATFVLFTLSMTKTQTINMDLPESSAKPPEGVPDPITISIDSSGNYYWNKELVSFDDILIRLTSLKQQEADPKVLINGEKGALFGPALAILDEARRAEISKVSFDTKTKESVTR